MFWSKARKIRKLELQIDTLLGDLNSRTQELAREKHLKVAAQESDKAYRKLAAERQDEIEKLKAELELMTDSNKGAQGEAAQNAEAYGHALLERSQEIEKLKNDYEIISSTYANTRHVIDSRDKEIEQLKGAYDYEFKLRREFEEELGRVRGELATLKVSPLGQIDDAVGSGVLSRTKDFTP